MVIIFMLLYMFYWWSIIFVNYRQQSLISKPRTLHFSWNFWINSTTVLTWPGRNYILISRSPKARSPVGSSSGRTFWSYLGTSIQSSRVPNKGNTCLLWLKNWSGDILKSKYPHLFSFAKKQKCWLKFFLDQEISTSFSLPLSSQEATQLSEIEALLHNRQLDPDINDTWIYNWGPLFQAKKAYKHMMGSAEASPLFTWLWSSSNLGKHKFFFGCS